LWCVRHLLRSLRAKCLSGLSLWPFSYFISSNTPDQERKSPASDCSNFNNPNEL
jgi:hypothetical protein